MWSKVNTRESRWERMTGREYGFENRAARVRRMARDADIDTSEETLPDTRRPGHNLPRGTAPTRGQLRKEEEAEARKALKKLEPLRKRLQHQLRVAEAKKRDRDVKKLRREIAELDAQIFTYRKAA